MLRSKFLERLSGAVTAVASAVLAPSGLFSSRFLRPRVERRLAPRLKLSAAFNHAAKSLRSKFFGRSGKGAGADADNVLAPPGPFASRFFNKPTAERRLSKRLRSLWKSKHFRKPLAP